LKQEQWFRRQKAWLIALTLLGVVAAMAWLLATQGERPIPASCMMIAAMGGILWRLGGANAWGTLLWGLAAAVLSAGFWTPASLHEFLFPSSMAFTTGGVLLSLPAGIIFLVASIKSQSRCAGNCAGFMMVVFTLAIYWTSGSTMRTYRSGPEAVQETRQLISILHRLAADIEKFRSERGRLPRDEAELIALRNKPMPRYYQDYRIGYSQQGSHDGSDGDYYLECGASQFWGHHWDIFPWIFLFYGPHATQRLQVILF
jgi:hypothetical protein